MPKVHLSVLVVEDGILYDLSHIKGNILNDRVIQQARLAVTSHTLVVRMRRDVMK